MFCQQFYRLERFIHIEAELKFLSVQWGESNRDSYRAVYPGLKPTQHKYQSSESLGESKIVLNHASLHHHVIKQIVDTSIAPKISEIADTFSVSHDEMVEALKALETYHGVVLHPNSAEVWVMHPFSTAPTGFWLESKDKKQGWWGNCAWCSLGAAALLDRDLSITTTLGGESKQVVIDIVDGQIQNQNLFIHFPIPMVKAWDNVIFTCSTMLMFESEQDIDDWCARHGMNKGDVQPIENIWAFSKVWYGNHLNPNWVKWTVDEAKAIFEQFGLTDAIWAMPGSGGRF